MPNIKPITAEQQSQVIHFAHQYIELASTVYSRAFPVIPINFELTGRAAGMYHLHQHKRYIRFNPYIFAKYFEDNLHNTVPHEVAHYIADMLFGIKNIKPHGTEWKSIMREFGVEAKTRCNYDLDGIPQRQHRRFRYQCLCRHYEISTRRHNIIRRGERHYRCPICKSSIRYAANL